MCRDGGGCVIFGRGVLGGWGVAFFKGENTVLRGRLYGVGGCEEVTPK